MGKLDKLNIYDQIEHMNAKGITFRSVNPNDAIHSFFNFCNYECGAIIGVQDSLSAEFTATIADDLIAV